MQAAVGLSALWTVVQFLPETMPRASASVISLASILQGCEACDRARSGPHHRVGAARRCAPGGLAMVAAVALGVTNALSLVLPITVYIVGLGLAMPQAMAGALTPFPQQAGAASSLLGFVQQVVASMAGIVVGQLLRSSALPLAIVIAALGALTLVLALVNCTPTPRLRAEWDGRQPPHRLPMR